MIKFINSHSYNELRYKMIGGKITGIWRGDSFFKGASSFPILNFKYYTSEFCDFEKNIVSADEKMIYHLNGYGTRHNEAMASFLGESVERYTFASFYKLLEKRIEVSNRDNLVEKYGEERVCSLELLNGFFAKSDTNDYLQGEDVIQWIRMNSLEELGKDVYVPLQMVVSDSNHIFVNEKRFMPAAVSTGTACHENFEKSLENALIEYMQIDSFNMWWYAGAKGKKLDINIEELLVKYFGLTMLTKEFCKKFEVRFTDISYDKDFDIIVCEIFGKDKNVPQYTVGVQGGKGISNCIYRGFMECIAVLEYNMHVLWLNHEKYMSINWNIVNSIGNLDDNVILYSKCGKPEKVKHDRELFVFKDNKNYDLINSACKLSKYSCFINITLPEFKGLNLNVTRVVLPELLPICLPSYPPYHHVRYKKAGGVYNEYPHPLA